MTREEAIEILSDVGDINRCCAEDAEALDMAIKALEQQPCEDCISRQEALSHKHIVYDDDGIGYSVVRVDEIMALPSVQPTRPTGKWIDIGDEGLVFKCSLCGNKKTIESNYCPNCGARMAESEGDK